MHPTNPAAPTVGLRDALHRGVLCRRPRAGDPVAIAPSAFDLELLAVVEAAAARQRPVAIVQPLPGTRTPVLLGAAMLVAAVGRRGRLDVTSAVISPDLEARALYDTLCFGPESLAAQVPRATVDSAGIEHTIAASLTAAAGRAGTAAARALRARQAAPAPGSGGHPGRLYLLHDPSRLDALRRLRAGRGLPALDAVVLDPRALPYGPSGLRDLNRMLTGKVSSAPLVYVTARPDDPGLDVLRRHGGLVWAFDHGCLTELATASTVTSGPARGRTEQLAATSAALTRAARSTVTVWMPDGLTALDDATRAAFNTLVALGRAYTAPRRTLPDGHPHPAALPGGTAVVASNAADAALWAWRVLATLMMLPVSAPRYDAALRPSPYSVSLATAGEVAREYAKAAPADLRSGWLDVAAALDAVVAASGTALACVAAWVGRQVSDGRRGVVITRNATAARATARALAEHPATPLGWETLVTVASADAVLTGRHHRLDEPGRDGSTSEDQTPVDWLLAGPVPRSAAALLGTPDADTVTVLAAGPWQAQRALAQARGVRGALADLRAGDTARAAAELGVDPALSQPSPPPALYTSAGIDPDPAPDPGAAAWEPFTADILADLEALARGRAGRIAPTLSSGTAAVVVGAVAIDVTCPDPDGGGSAGVLLLPANDLVTVRDRTGVRPVTAKSLQPDQQLLLVDLSARREVFSAVMDRLSQLPTYRSIHALVDVWRRHAAAAADSRYTYAQILTRMTGTRLTDPTAVGTWIRGATLGPLDSDDVARFARAVGDTELEAMASQVGMAVAFEQRLRRKVGKWLAEQVTGAITAPADMVIDHELGVHVTDLLDTVTVHTVRSPAAPCPPVPATAVGVLLDPDTARKLLTGPVTVPPSAADSATPGDTDAATGAAAGGTGGGTGGATTGGSAGGTAGGAAGVRDLTAALRDTAAHDAPTPQAAREPGAPRRARAQASPRGWDASAGDGDTSGADLARLFGRGTW